MAIDDAVSKKAAAIFGVDDESRRRWTEETHSYRAERAQLQAREQKYWAKYDEKARAKGIFKNVGEQVMNGANLAIRAQMMGREAGAESRRSYPKGQSLYENLSNEVREESGSAFEDYDPFG